MEGLGMGHGGQGRKKRFHGVVLKVVIVKVV